MPVTQGRTGRRWLLPHERWLGRYAGRVQDSSPGGRRWQFQQRYGPEGDVFLTAYLADMLAAFLLCAAGVVLLDVHGSGPKTAGGCLLAAGILIGLLGLARAYQLGQAGRAFRADRPPLSR